MRPASGDGIRKRRSLTDHCFTGDYPTPLSDLEVASPRKLSLLAEPIGSPS